MPFLQILVDIRMDGEAMDKHQVWVEEVLVRVRVAYMTIRIHLGNNEWLQRSRHPNSIHPHKLIHRQIEPELVKRFSSGRVGRILV